MKDDSLYKLGKGLGEKMERVWSFAKPGRGGVSKGRKNKLLFWGLKKGKMPRKSLKMAPTNCKNFI